MNSTQVRSLLASLLLLAGLTASVIQPLPVLAAPFQEGTAAQTGTDRPMVVVESYSTDTDPLTPGKNFTLYLTLRNKSQQRTDTGQDVSMRDAYNVMVTFTPGTLIPRDTGGTITIPTGLGPEQKKELSQPMVVDPAALGNSVGNITATITYSDETGASYTQSFNIALSIAWPSYSTSPTKTPTPITIARPQISINSYETDVDPLQPGVPFTLKLNAINTGSGDAKGVTMIMGGGSGSSTGVSETPVPGGISGGSGDFANFAPLKSSNIHYIGDIQIGQAITIDQPLITNTSTNPGAYSIKISFSYVDGRGNQYNDDQVITLLVYQKPLVDITFYQDPGPFYVGQPGPLPIQITNLSRKPTVLGNMKATVKQGGQVTNNVTLIGAMDAGGYFTLDAMLIPEQAGPMTVDITVNYTDDFNQPQTIEAALQVTVEEMPTDMGMGTDPTGGVPSGKPGEVIDPGMMAPTQPETFWDKVKRFAKGMIGLDSGVEQPAIPIMGGGGGGGDGSSGGKMVIPAQPMKGG